MLQKNILSLGKRIHSIRRSTLLVFYLFIWASCKWKKQYFTFNNSSVAQMLAKDHVLFLKKILKIFSRPKVCNLYNSKSGLKILQFLYYSNHQIV